MDANRQIQQRLAQVFERMAQPVLWQELRDAPQELPLHGYLTRGAGPDAPWEFRFQKAVAGLRQGGVLRQAASEERWCIAKVLEERLETELLYVIARVEPLQAAGAPPLEQDVDALLQALQQALDASTLPPLEHADLHEALQRLAGLCPKPAEAGYASRIKARLQLLAQGFKACPQTGNDAKRLLLKLEAQLKRRGYPA